MAKPTPPLPCPTMKEGLALGAPEHRGFVRVWNWLMDALRHATKYFVTTINNRTGDVAIVAGEGIDIFTNGRTITISAGSGRNDDGDSDDDPENGGGATEDEDTPWTEVEPEETDGTPLSTGSFHFNAKTGTVASGAIMVARTPIHVNGTTAPSDGYLTLKVTIGASPTVAWCNDNPFSSPASEYDSYLPVYSFSGGKISEDYRGCLNVQAYE